MPTSTLTASIPLNVWNTGEQKNRSASRTVCQKSFGLPHSGDLGFRGFHHFGETLRIMDGNLGEHLAVELDTGLSAAVDKSAVGNPVHAACGIDADDPQAAEIAFFVLTVHIGHGLCTVNSFSGCAEKLATRASETLGELQAAVSSAARGRGIGYSWHDTVSTIR